MLDFPSILQHQSFNTAQSQCVVYLKLKLTEICINNIQEVGRVFYLVMNTNVFRIKWHYFMRDKVNIYMSSWSLVYFYLMDLKQRNESVHSNKK